MPLPDPATSRVVLAGTASYRHDDYPALPAVRNNLAGLRAALTDPRLWGIPVENVRVVTDPEQPSQITELLRPAAREATDTLIFYYAGHGFLSERDPTLFLTCKGSLGNSGSSALEYKYVREEMLDSRALRKIVILDCCYSGNAHAVMSGDAALQDITGAYVLTSSRRNQASTAPTAAQHTAFTGALLKVLTDGIDRLPGQEDLTLNEIYRQVRADLVRDGFGEPDRRDHGTAGDLPIVHNQAYRTGPERVNPPAPVPADLTSVPDPTPVPTPAPAPARAPSRRLWQAGPAAVSAGLGAVGGAVVAVTASGAAGIAAGIAGAAFCYVTTVIAGARS